MDIETKLRLRSLALALAAFSLLGYLAVTAGTSAGDFDRVAPSSSRTPRPAVELQNTYTNLRRTHVQRAAVDARATDLASQPAAPPLSGPAGYLSLRDTFYDVAIANDLDPKLWQREDVRDAFRERCKLRAIIDIVDTHAALQLAEFRGGELCHTLAGRISAGAPGVIRSDDLDTWAMVSAFDAVPPPQWRDGEDVDQYVSKPERWALQAKLCELDPFQKLLDEIESNE